MVVDNFYDPEINPDVHVATVCVSQLADFRSGDSRVQDAFSRVLPASSSKRHFPQLLAGVRLLGFGLEPEIYQQL